MTERLFDSQPVQDAASVTLLKRVALLLLVVLLVLLLVVMTLSGYRAYVQVQDLELHAPAGRLLRDGSAIEASAISSGRTFVDVRLELIQGAHAETLATLQVPKNRYASIDPRSQRATLAFTLTPQLLARFQDGAAQLRATASGRAQWLRTPPPVVREMPVEIQREAGR